VKSTLIAKNFELLIFEYKFLLLHDRDFKILGSSQKEKKVVWLKLTKKNCL
jgi:hypothetical protein